MFIFGNEPGDDPKSVLFPFGSQYMNSLSQCYTSAHVLGSPFVDIETWADKDLVGFLSMRDEWRERKFRTQFASQVSQALLDDNEFKLPVISLGSNVPPFNKERS